jgi:hypothetical protein
MFSLSKNHQLGFSLLFYLVVLVLYVVAFSRAFQGEFLVGYDSQGNRTVDFGACFDPLQCMDMQCQFYNSIFNESDNVNGPFYNDVTVITGFIEGSRDCYGDIPTLLCADIVPFSGQYKPLWKYMKPCCGTYQCLVNMWYMWLNLPPSLNVTYISFRFRNEDRYADDE